MPRETNYEVELIKLLFTKLIFICKVEICVPVRMLLACCTYNVLLLAYGLSIFYFLIMIICGMHGISSIYEVHDEAKDKAFELEMS